MLLKSSVFLTAASLAAGQFITCPTYFRAVNSYLPSAAGVTTLDVYANDVKVASNVNFRDVTQYIQVNSGPMRIGVRAAGAAATIPFLATANFTASAGKFYTAGFLGNVPGPAGQLVYSQVPVIVNEDDRRVPNPNRWFGLWYRWSETNLAIDFRTVSGNPNPPADVIAAPDVERITQLAPKTVIPIGELPTGQTYSLYPTTIGSNAPLANPRVPGGYVAVRGLQPTYGKLYDFFATGDSLLNDHANNLAVQYTETPVSFDSASGCTVIPGKADYAAANAAAVRLIYTAARAAGTPIDGLTDNNASTLSTINGVTIATLVCAAVAVLLSFITAGLVVAGRKQAPSAKPLTGAAAGSV